MASRSSPWSWQPPPLPPSLSLLGPTPKSFPPSRIWHRPFWGIEGYSALCTRQLPGVIDIILSCQLSSSATNHRVLDHQLVRSVVQALRFEHPTIASRYAWPDIKSGKQLGPEEGQFAYEVPHSEHDVQVWLSEVVFDRSDALVAADNNVDSAIANVRRELGKASTAPPSSMFQLHHIPSASPAGSHGIILRLGHTLFDGIGAFQIMDLLVTKLAQLLALESTTSPLAWGEEVSRLVGPVPDRSKVSWSEEKIEQDGDMIKKLHEALKFAKNAHGLPVPNPNATASTTGVFLRSISPEVLSELLAVARMHGCTLFSVMFAAEMLAMLRLNPPSRKDGITTASFPSAFSLRGQHLMTDPLDRTNREVAGALGFNVLLARDLGRFVAEGEDRNDEKRLLDDLFVLAKEIRAQMDDQRKYMSRASLWVHEMMMAIASFVTGTASQPQSEPPPDPTPTLSSLGVVDEHLASSHVIPSGGRIEVTNPIFTVCTPYAPYSFPLIVHPYTWGGKLYISFSYPEAYMGSVEDLLKAKGTAAGGTSVLDMIDEFMNILTAVAQSGR